MKLVGRALLSVVTCSVALLAMSSDAHSTVVQVDGTVVPALTDNIQNPLNDAEGVAPPAANAINAILDASQLPEIFLPDLTEPVVFYDVFEGAGFENSFGYYNVGDDPTNTANLRPILGCGVSAASHANEVPNYVVSAEPGSTVSVNFAAERTAGRYRGGYIAFYLIAPKARLSDPDPPINCGDFNGSARVGRAYFTQRQLNNDGDFVHHLTYQSRITTDRFYFGFEDLFRGGDNDFEDMLIQVTGLTPPCAPEVEACNNRDDDCDGTIDEDIAASACTCNGVGITCQGGARQGVCQMGQTACVSGGLICRPGSPTGESCNVLDDDCDGRIDENTTGSGLACDGTDADLCPEGATQCVAGSLVCSDTTGSSTETCNGVDDDCDTRVDESVVGLGVSCDGTDGDLCREGVTQCVAGREVCSDSTGTINEICNNGDDDCDTRIDENATDVGVACTSGQGACLRAGATVCMGGMPTCNAVAATPTAERCNALDDDCDGSIDETFSVGSACDPPGGCGVGVRECAGPDATVCSTGPGGSNSQAMTERCNGLDDDCDGRIDEGLTDLGPCTEGSDVGECARGRQQCIGGAPRCVGGIGPAPQDYCDGLDNDCDGRIDEAPARTCGNEVGECSPGNEVCRNGQIVCDGAVGPRPETCNGLDDDCNGLADDDTTDVGDDCGTTDVGVCRYGATICDMGVVRCNGATEPGSEVCNGLDDDCDGTTDENPIDVGEICGSAMGACEPGRTVCVNGEEVCAGGTMSMENETCNGIDDDCDNNIDEDPSDPTIGMACGSSVGACQPGAYRCVAGEIACVGGVAAGTEVCNGVDDDCDGEIDGTALCGDDGICRNANCVYPCFETEFGLDCPSGDICVDAYCEDDACYGVDCPADADGTRNICRDSACVSVCSTVTCSGGTVCRRTDGVCVPSNCLYLPYLCAAGQVCDQGACVSDPCNGVSCDAAEFCREGTCVASCAGVRCTAADTECRDGVCMPTGCTGCAAEQVCLARTRQCVARTASTRMDGGIDGDGGVELCSASSCGPGFICRGECIEDRCSSIDCPTGQVCDDGNCFNPEDLVVAPAEMDAGAGAPFSKVLAAGGGGTICSVRAGAGRAHHGAAMLLGMVGLLFAWRRRRSQHAKAGGLARQHGLVRLLGLARFVGLIALLVSAGCEVDPYCLRDCDGGADFDAGRDAAVRADGSVDARVRTDGHTCTPGAVELCNELDDDCDTQIDETIDLSRDSRHCGSCDISCELPGAQTECVEGVCRFQACFGGNVDINGDTTQSDPFTGDGCEYQCAPSNRGAETCDGVDNDCDRRIDEDTMFQTDVRNCGRCGVVCDFFHVTNSVCTDGVCAFDRTNDCEDGFIDSNDTQSDGCEFQCTPSGAEVCDGLDNDCDTTTDEGFALQTDPLNCGRCNLTCTFPHATPRCTAGSCGFDPANDCEPGYSDRNGVQIDGCEYPCTPTADPTEICDGVDNDCDGRVDNSARGTNVACNRSPNGVARGLCTNTGMIQCVNRQLVCIGAPEPQREVCNGMDDDCDGMVDNDSSDVGRLCEQPVGLCSAGFTECNAGRLDCVRETTPTSEICNGLDDDCDGTVDDNPTDANLGRTCGTDVGECVAGRYACTSGSLVCQGEVARQLETCNGRDDDCDGVVDDDPVDAGNACGSAIGACVQGSEVCVGATLVCQGGIRPGTEDCDNIDDDCDGRTDESVAAVSCYTGAAGTFGVGPCRGGRRSCTAGAFGACLGQVLPELESCNNIDDDCDGRIDEGITRSCYTGSAATRDIGACQSGTQTCGAGAFAATCVGQVLPATSESCDDRDNDCDGRVDESTGGAPLTQSCYSGAAGTSGVGTCISGTRTCRFGSFDVCAGQVVPTLDRCGDSMDTDCDGLSDAAEGCLSAGTDTRLDQGMAGAAHSYEVQVAVGGSPRGRNVYVAWVDKAAGATRAEILFSRSTNGGRTFSAPVTLSANSSGTRSIAPRIAVGIGASSDVVYVTYQTTSVDGEGNSDGYRALSVRRSTNSGSSFSSAQELANSGSGGDANRVDNFNQYIATDDAGTRAVVAWEELRSTTSGSQFITQRRVVSRASTNSGGGWSAVRTVSVNASNPPVAGAPVATVTSTGRFVFVWREVRAPGRPTFDIYATYSDDATSAIPSAREARLDGDSSQQRTSEDLQIVSSGQNVFVVFSDVSTVGGSDITLVRSTNNAANWQTERILDDPAVEVSSSFGPTLAIDPRTASITDDRVFVAWSDTREGTQIYFTRTDDSGANFTSPVRASNQGAASVSGINDEASIAYLGGNQLVIGYVNDAAGAASFDRVRAAVSIDSGTSWQITDPVIDTGGGDANSVMIAPVDATGPALVGALLAWVDLRSGTRTNGDIYRTLIGR